MKDGIKLALPDFLDGDDKVVLFDGVCTLCTRWVKFLLRYDTSPVFKLVSVQSEKGQAILKAAEFPTTYFETLILVQEGKIYTQSTAIIMVLSQLSSPWKWLQVGRIIPSVLIDPVYHFVATRRYRLFGRHSACYLPSLEQQDRFL